MVWKALIGALARVQILAEMLELEFGAVWCRVPEKTLHVPVAETCKKKTPLQTRRAIAPVTQWSESANLARPSPGNALLLLLLLLLLLAVATKSH